MALVRVLATSDDLRVRIEKSVVSFGHGLASRPKGPGPDLVLAEMAPGERYGDRWKEPPAGGTPVLAVIVGRGEVNLDGVEDFLFDPFDPAELDLRVRRVLARAGRGDEALKLGDLLVNFDEYEVTLGGRPLNLTFKEYELLKSLLINRGRVMSRDTLLRKVWGYDFLGGTRTVDVHVRRLRAKLGSHQDLIETVRNVGYRIRREPGNFVDASI